MKFGDMQTLVGSLPFLVCIETNFEQTVDNTVLGPSFVAKQISQCIRPKRRHI